MAPSVGTSATHRVWNIPELARHIVSYLPTKYLPSLARTAKFLHGDVSAYLWEHVNLSALAHITRVLFIAPMRPPAGAIDPYRAFMRCGELRFEPKSWEENPVERQLWLENSVQWNRFDVYAAHVRHVDIQFDIPHSVSEPEERGAVQFLLRSREGQAPFPLLQSLTLHSLSPSDFAIATRFLTASVCAVTIANFWVGRLKDEDNEISFFREIRIHAPQVRELRLDCPTASPGVAESIATTIQSLPRLVQFRSPLTTFCPNVLAALSNAPALREMIIMDPLGDIGESEYLDDGYVDAVDDFTPSVFRLLAAIRLHGPLENTTRFLNAMDAPLQMLTLRAKANRFTLNGPLAVGGAVAGYSHTLEKLNISVDETLLYSHDPFSWTEYDALLSCRQLTSFRFTCISDRSMALTDAQAFAMAQAWPRLTNLTLKWRELRRIAGAFFGGLADESAFTLAALRAFALHCPHLLTLDLTSMHVDAVLDSRSCHNGQPIKLCIELIGVPLESDVVRISEFLDELWPVLDFQGSSFGRGSLGKSLKSHVRVLQISRRLTTGV